ILLIEASRIGYGASGRNSGFILDHNSHNMHEDKATEIYIRNNALCAAGTRELRELVRSFGIDCGWSDWGRVYVSAGDMGDRLLAQLEADFRRRDIAYTRWGAEEMRVRLGTPFYRAGLK